MNKPDENQLEEFNILDLWEKLRKDWRYVASGTLIGVVAGVVSIVVSSPKYEAVAIVQVGQVGQVGQTIGLPVEAATHAIERMKTPAFQLAVAQSIENRAWIDDLSSFFGNTSKYLSLQILKSTASSVSPLIELRARGATPDGARRIVEASVDELAKRHSELAKPILDKVSLDLAVAKEKLTSAERELEGINKLVLSASIKDDRFTQFSLLTSLRIQKESELFSQRQAIKAYEAALHPPFTQPARVLEAIYVPKNPVSAKKILRLAIGLIGGSLAGMALIYLRNAFRRAKRTREAVE